MRDIVPIADIPHRLPTHGRIRLGKKDGNMPVAIAHFRFTSPDKSAIAEIAEHYGGTPKPWAGSGTGAEWEVETTAEEIPVALPPDPLCGTPIYELWTAAGFQRRCDGVECELPGESGPDHTTVPCLCLAKKKMECSPKTRLNVILREVTFGGVWRLESGGWNVAHEMPGMVATVSALQQKGLVTAILALEKRKVKKAHEKFPRKFVVPVLRPSVSIDALAAGGGTVQALASASQAPPPVPELDDPEVVDAEVIEE